MTQYLTKSSTLFQNVYSDMSDILDFLDMHIIIMLKVDYEITSLFNINISLLLY